MSTIRANKYENTSTSDGGISIDNSGHVTVDGQQMPTAGALSHRNLVVNGGMAVAQRGTSSTSAGYQTVDRWKTESGGGTITQSQHTLSSTDDPYSKGFRNSFHVNVDSAGSNAVTDFLYITQFIEAQNIAQSGWNYTSSSSYITLSFNVKSSLAGTYYVYLRAHDATSRGYVKAFTLTADTWSEVTCTVPGDSTLVFNDDNGIGLEVGIRPYVGTEYSDSGVSAGAWFTRSGTSQTPDYAQNFVATASATFEITGVQLEVGEKATPFEHRSYGDELARCQRYYHKVTAAGSTGYATSSGQSARAFATISFPVAMRAAPNFTNNATLSSSGVTTTVGDSTIGTDGHAFSFTSNASGGTFWSISTGTFDYSAEL